MKVAKLHSFLFVALLPIAFSLIVPTWSIATPPDKSSSKNSSIDYKWVTEGGLEEEESVCFRAFKEAYKDFDLKEQKIDNLEQLLSLEDDPKDLNNQEKEVYCRSAYVGNKVVGFATFDELDSSGKVYIRQMAVDPNYWGRGIGKQLTFSILKKLQEIKQLALIACSANTGAIDFYKKIGFTKSEYMHEGYDTKLYIGLECKVQD